MSKTTYSLQFQYDGCFSQAVTDMRESLQEQGFGILIEVDVKKTLIK